MHPKDASSPYPSEQLIIEALSIDDENQSTHVIHSLKVSGGKHRLEGEADFIFLIPFQGIVVVEAKAPVDVENKDGRLKLYGVGDDEVDPFEQTGNTRQVMLDHLKRNLGIQPAVAEAVWFTSLEAKKLAAVPDGMKIKFWQVLSNDDLKQPSTAVLEVIERYNEEHKAKRLYDDPAKFTPTLLEAARKALQDEFSIMGSKKLQQEHREIELRRLEERQKEDLDLVEKNQHIYFYGPAGTGKSLLITESARRAEESGDRVLFVCWNRLMAQEVAQEFEGINPGITVRNIGDLMADVAGVEHPADANTEWYLTSLPNKALEAAIRNDDHERDYDLIVVDEFQDIAAQPKFLKFLEQLGKNRTWKETRLVAAGDKYQQIMRNGEFVANPTGAVQSMVQDLTQVRLATNYRNSERIAKALNVLAKNDRLYERYARKGFPGEIEIIEVSDSTAPRRLLEQIQQLQNEYVDSQIRILSPSSDGNALHGKILAAADNALYPELAQLKQLLRVDGLSDGPIQCLSIMKYKGLESDAIIIPDVNLEQKDKWIARNKDIYEMLYVGFSRAHHKVVVLCDGAMAKELRALKL